ncbi:MAG: CoA ester lyase [Acidobacteriota bacterium]|nr:MAG: CoA ester lyase [Acidobacteriota bacterium]
MIVRRRSILYLPGSSQRMMAKAGSRGADVLVLDLEDGVHPDLKSAAREQIQRALERFDWRESEVFIRANGLDTAWGADDIDFIADVRPRGALLPKCEDPRVVEDVASRLGPSVGLFLMVETAEGVLEAAALACASNVAGLVFGAADYRASLRAGRLPDETELLFARAQILHAARAAGIEAFDTPWFEYKDADGLEASAHRVRQMGFDGKTAIHPSQVPVINRVFSPSSEEVDRARRIIEVMERASAEGKNVATLDDEMVEALHLEESKRILARAGTEQPS